MGKSKQSEKKFNRNVEISAPILDPAIIRAIHSPPRDQKMDVRHGGFRALLTDLNSQDSTDELTPITENHLPSYIGISCAVSGYSNYSSYGKKLSTQENKSSKLDGPADNKVTAHKLASSSSSRPNRSHTNSPVAVRADQPNIHHVVIDKSNIGSIEEERRELTEKLTASATERHRSPSPIPPTEDDRHHGAYVGARYFPMPEPSKAVQKHIPLLGIDDDVDPNELAPEDVNKVEQKIASLYGEEFVEDWKESMSHKAKKEHQDEAQLASEQATKNLRDLVTLKPTPPKQEEPAQPVVDVPTPPIKVLASVEKQFLNRLLTDENPPMPKSPSPQPTSPLSPKIKPTSSHEETKVSHQVEPQPHLVQDNPTPPRSPSPPIKHQESAPEVHRESRVELSRSPSPPCRTEALNEPQIASQLSGSVELAHNTGALKLDQHLGEPSALGDMLIGAVSSNQESQDPEPESRVQLESLIDISAEKNQAEPEVHAQIAVPSEHMNEDGSQDLLGTLDEVSTSEHRNDFADGAEPDTLDLLENNKSPSPGSVASRPDSPNSERSTSTVERAPVNVTAAQGDAQDTTLKEVHDIEPHNMEEQSLVDVADAAVNQDDFSLVTAREIITQETDNLVSFSPEPAVETNNNIEPQVKQTSEEADVIDADAVPDKYSPGLSSIQEAVSESLTDVPAEGNAAVVSDETGKVDGHYFLNLLNAEESFIMEQVRKAEQKLAEQESEMDEDQLGKIHSAIGKANLLINKKCNQFKGLCEQSLNGNANQQYAVLSDDLAGFWDMISIQIADVRKSFENL